MNTLAYTVLIMSRWRGYSCTVRGWHASSDVTAGWWGAERLPPTPPGLTTPLTLHHLTGNSPCDRGCSPNDGLVTDLCQSPHRRCTAVRQVLVLWTNRHDFESSHESQDQSSIKVFAVILSISIVVCPSICIKLSGTYPLWVFFEGIIK